MRELFEKLESPAVRGLAARFTEAVGADITPNPLPDLYKGEPIVLAAKVGTLDGDLEVSGTIGKQPWRAVLPLAGAAVASGISKIYARRKISDAEVARITGQLKAEDADARILDLAMRHSLVSRLTSLIAVDQSPSRPDDAILTRADVPLNLPKGWDFEKVFGPRGETSGLRGTRDAGLGQADGRPIQKAAFNAVSKRSAPVSRQQLVQQAQNTVRLPNTATDAELRLLVGLVLLLMSLALIAGLRGHWRGTGWAGQ